MTKSPALRAVEGELQQQMEELSGSLREICEYATEGGRRIRSGLLLGAAMQPNICAVEACASLPRPLAARAVQAAAALEMLHAATLLQDDLFDASTVRRGRAAAHVRFGKAQAILASDWLLIRALEMAAEVDVRFFRCLACAGTTMAQAEAREFEPAILTSIEEAERYGHAIATGKTAVLFGAAMCGAAVLRGVPPAECDGWQALGTDMGWTYQLVDDCVDLYVGEADAGKSVGHDLTAGCLTLPVILAASWMSEQGICVCMEQLQRGQLESRELDEVSKAVRSVEVKRRLQKKVQERLIAHREEARRLGVSDDVVESWAADVLTRAALCFDESEQPPEPEFTSLMDCFCETRQHCAG